MKIGTRTLFFGVHQFVWHPFTVWRAWRWMYGTNPNWWQLLAIVFHDVGYLGRADIDGREGKRHPYRGARWVMNIVDKFSPETAGRAYYFTLLHSREAAKENHMSPTALCWADKASVLFDPPWFYLLRARLAGELPEFKHNAEPIIGKVADEVWLNWYRARVRDFLLRLSLREGLTKAARGDLVHGRR